MSRFSKELNFISCHYSVEELPFKKHQKFLPDNYNNVKIQLHKFLNKASKDLLMTYNEIIKIQEKENVIERVHTTEENGSLTNKEKNFIQCIITGCNYSFLT